MGLVRKPSFNIGHVWNIIFVLFYILCISIFFTKTSEGALSYNLNGVFGTPNSNTKRLVTTLYTEQKRKNTCNVHIKLVFESELQLNLKSAKASLI